MSEVKPIIFHRSGAETDWSCRQKRYWGYELYGTGVNAPEHPYELYLGTLIHDGVAAMAHDVPIDQIAQAGVTQLRAKLLEGRERDSDAQFLADEQCALAEGLLRGFHRAHWPRICADYPEIVLCEKDLPYDYNIDGRPLRFVSKADLVRRDKEGQLWIFEWKTTGSIKEEWINSWQTAAQVHAQMKVVEQHLNEPVAGCIVQGFYKSYVSQWNRLESIFAYAYHHPGNPPFEKPRWAYEYKAGLKKYPIWNRDGGVKQWVAEMPLPLLQSQFPQTPPIFANEQIIEDFFQGQGLREIEIKDHRPDDPWDPANKRAMMQYFPKMFTGCNAYNRICGFKRLCFGSPVDPLSIGFEPRVSHHQLEQESLDADNK